MAKLKTKLESYDSKSGEAIYVYEYRNKTFVGTAKSHPEEYASLEMVGLKYAETRAFLKYLKYRKQEHLTKLIALEGVLKNMLTSKDFNPYSSYAKKIRHEIKITKEIIEDCNIGIKTLPEILKTDMKNRDSFNSKLITLRKNGGVFPPRFKQIDAE